MEWPERQLKDNQSTSYWNNSLQISKQDWLALTSSAYFEQMTHWHVSGDHRNAPVMSSECGGRNTSRLSISEWSCDSLQLYHSFIKCWSTH
jgi:hypothetical protein